MKNIILSLVKGLCNNEEKVEVSEEIKGNLCIYHVKVDEDDMGRVIGAGGKNINAITTLIKSFGFKKDNKLRYIIKINDEQKNEVLL